MASAAVTYTFAPNTTIESAKANQNFTDLVTFLNNSVIHKDGSVAFTGIPSGPASNPTTDNQLTRKAYVDAADILRLQQDQTSANSNTQTSGTWTPGTNQIKWIAESKVGTTGTGGSAGRLVITFPDSGFTNHLLTVVPQLGDVPSGIGASIVNVVHSNTSKTQVDVVVTDAAGAGISGGSVRVNYIALGW